jgi:hypothetical protein
LQDFNYFGYGSEEEWLNAFEKLAQFYYNEFETIHQEMAEGKRRGDKGIAFRYHK